MLRENAVLQELSTNAEGKCCSARAERKCARDIKRSYCDKYETFLCSVHISFVYEFSVHISVVIPTVEKASLLQRRPPNVAITTLRHCVALVVIAIATRWAIVSPVRRLPPNVAMATLF